MKTIVEIVLEWLIPGNDAPEEARTHLRPKVSLPWKEALTRPPAREHKGKKDDVWINTVNKLVQTIGTTPTQKVNSVYLMEDDRKLAPSFERYIRPSHVYCNDPIRQNSLENLIQCPSCINRNINHNHNHNHNNNNNNNNGGGGGNNMAIGTLFMLIV